MGTNLPGHPTTADGSDGDQRPAGGGALSLLSLPVRWLRNVPVADPVDRRNAPMLQLVLLLLGGLPPLAWAYRAFAMDVPWREGELGSMALSLLLSAVALAGFALVRLGHFRWAAYQLLAVFAVSVCLSYAGSGFGSQRFEQPVLTVCMVIGALVVGRGALWGVTISIWVAFGLGVWRDRASDGTAELIVDGIISGVIFLLIAVVLDRASSALRQSLVEAKAKGRDASEAYVRLQGEVEQRRKVEQQLVHARKIEAVARLAAGLNHDFNHLLSLILGYVQQAKRGQTSEKVAASLAGAETAVRKADTLSRRLLTFSRQSDTVIDRHEVRDVVDDLAPLLRQTVSPGVRIHTEIPADLWVDFDRDQLGLILLNLLSNADDAMGGEGDIRLTAQETASGVCVSCIDTGPGIEAELQARIFEPFVTTKAPSQGTGLGLAMARDLMSAHGGSIAVESTLGRGTIFSLHFAQSSPAVVSRAVELS